LYRLNGGNRTLLSTSLAFSLPTEDIKGSVALLLLLLLLSLPLAWPVPAASLVISIAASATEGLLRLLLAEDEPDSTLSERVRFTAAC
jgi:hypothetical protein